MKWFYDSVFGVSQPTVEPELSFGNHCCKRLPCCVCVWGFSCVSPQSSLVPGGGLFCGSGGGPDGDVSGPSRWAADSIQLGELWWTELWSLMWSRWCSAGWGSLFTHDVRALVWNVFSELHCLFFLSRFVFTVCKMKQFLNTSRWIWLFKCFPHSLTADSALYFSCLLTFNSFRILCAFLTICKQ